MRKFIILIIITTMWFGESLFCQNHIPIQGIQAIEVKNFSPMMGETLYRAYYMDPFIMYESQTLVSHSLFKNKFDSATNEISPHEVYTLKLWVSHFFVFHKDSSYGYNYDSVMTVTDNKRFRVDSTLKSIQGTNGFDNVLKIKPDSSTWNADKTEMKEVYISPEKIDTPATQLNLYYSIKLNHVKESFNHILDSAKKMKLFKTEIIIHEFYSEKGKNLWPEIKDVTEMREITVENTDQIISYFDRYKKSIGQK